MNFFIYFLLILVSISLTNSAPVSLVRQAQKPTNTSTIALSENVELTYSVDVTTNSANFNLSVYDAEVFQSHSERTWLSFGFTESTTSGFLGGDIVTVQFMAHVSNECRVHDSFLPFAAYPLDYALPGVRHSSSIEDKCQNDSSWTVKYCERNVATKTVSVSLYRPLTAIDGQDRELGPGIQHAIYSYGNGAEASNFASGKHSGRHLRLYEADGSISATPLATRNLPADIWGNHTISASNHTVNSQYRSSYACTSLEAAVPVGGSASLIAFEAVLSAKRGRLAVGSMVLYACPKFAGFKYLLGTQGCGSLPGQFPNPSSFCTDVLFTWANGVDRFVLPKDVSFVIDDSNKYLVLETMYHNPNLEAGLIDESGVMIHYSKDVRKHAAGTLVLGDAIGARKGTLVNNAELSSTCSSACTQNFDQALHIFASSPRMHYTGRSIATHKYDARGKLIETVSRVDYWSAANQATQVLERQVTLSPGDQLATTCRYDTRKLPHTRFGFSMDEEVCIDYAFYYPRQKNLDQVKGLPLLPSGGSMTYCGVSSAGVLNGTLCGNKMLPDKNMPLNTAAAKQDTFGEAPAMCVTALPRAEPTIKPRRASGPSCFPANAQVRLRDARIKQMHELEVGDEVEVRPDVYSPVIGFTHRERFSEHTFVSIQVGRSTLQSSPGHFVYASGQLIKASSVTVGDTMVDSQGNERTVGAISNTRGIGLYNPQTLDGNIIVNNIVVSTYTDAVKSSAAHASLAVLRTIFQLFGTSKQLAFMLENGAHKVRAMSEAWTTLIQV